MALPINQPEQLTYEHQETFSAGIKGFDSLNKLKDGRGTIALDIQNMDVTASGSLKKRAGTRLLGSVPDQATASALLPVLYNGKEFLISISHAGVGLYDTTTDEQLHFISSNGGMMEHPAFIRKALANSGADSWTTYYGSTHEGRFREGAPSSENGVARVGSQPGVPEFIGSFDEDTAEYISTWFESLHPGQYEPWEHLYTPVYDKSPARIGYFSPDDLSDDFFNTIKGVQIENGTLLILHANRVPTTIRIVQREGEEPSMVSFPVSIKEERPLTGSRHDTIKLYGYGFSPFLSYAPSGITGTVIKNARYDNRNDLLLRSTTRSSNDQNTDKEILVTDSSQENTIYVEEISLYNWKTWWDGDKRSRPTPQSSIHAGHLEKYDAPVHALRDNIYQANRDFHRFDALAYRSNEADAQPVTDSTFVKKYYLKVGGRFNRFSIKLSQAIRWDRLDYPIVLNINDKIKIQLDLFVPKEEFFTGNNYQDTPGTPTTEDSGTTSWLGSPIPFVPAGTIVGGTSAPGEAIFHVGSNPNHVLQGEITILQFDDDAEDYEDDNNGGVVFTASVVTLPHSTFLYRTLLTSNSASPEYKNFQDFAIIENSTAVIGTPINPPTYKDYLPAGPNKTECNVNYTSTHNNPSGAFLVENRLVLTGFKSNGLTILASKLNQINDFDLGNADPLDGIQLSIDSDYNDTRIVFMGENATRTVLFTDKAQYEVTNTISGQAGISASTLAISLFYTASLSSITPVTVLDSFFAVNSDGYIVEFAYDYRARSIIQRMALEEYGNVLFQIEKLARYFNSVLGTEQLIMQRKDKKLVCVGLNSTTGNTATEKVSVLYTVESPAYPNLKCMSVGSNYSGSSTYLLASDGHSTILGVFDASKELDFCQPVHSREGENTLRFIKEKEDYQFKDVLVASNQGDYTQDRDFTVVDNVLTTSTTIDEQTLVGHAIRTVVETMPVVASPSQPFSITSVTLKTMGDAVAVVTVKDMQTDAEREGYYSGVVPEIKGRRRIKLTQYNINSLQTNIATVSIIKDSVFDYALYSVSMLVNN